MKLSELVGGLLEFVVGKHRRWVACYRFALLVFIHISYLKHGVRESESFMLLRWSYPVITPEITMDEHRSDL